MYKYTFKLVFPIFNPIYITILSSKHSKNRYTVGKLIFLVTQSSFQLDTYFIFQSWRLVNQLKVYCNHHVLTAREIDTPSYTTLMIKNSITITFPLNKLYTSLWAKFAVDGFTGYRNPHQGKAGQTWSGYKVLTQFGYNIIFTPNGRSTNHFKNASELMGLIKAHLPLNSSHPGITLL